MDIPEDVINSMCLTWRHDFGLDAAPVSNLTGSGMSAGERNFLRGQMRQLYQHHVLPAILAERERAARVCEHQAHAFLSPEYAGDQPLGSFFACASCADAIRALSPSLKEEGN